MPLKGRRRLFVDAYIANGMNGAKAARDAGYDVKVARITASELLREPSVKEAVAERFKESAMAAEEVLHRLKEQASCTIEDFFDFSVDEGLLKILNDELTIAIKVSQDKKESQDVRKAAKDQIARLQRTILKESDPGFRLNLKKAEESGKIHLIKGIKWTPDGRPILEFHDAQTALLNIGKGLSLFVDRIDHTSGGDKIEAFGYEVVRPGENPSGPGEGSTESEDSS